MILTLVLFSIALAVQPAYSYPLGIYADSAQSFDIQTDFDAYSGPWNYGNRFWSGGLGGGYGGGLGGGLGGGYGGILGGSRGLYGYDGFSDNIEYDIGYTIEPSRRVDVGRDRLVRDFAVTETDNWVRDQTSYRTPTRVRYATVPTRRVYSTGIGGPRTSSLRTGGDLFFLRR